MIIWSTKNFLLLIGEDFLDEIKESALQMVLAKINLKCRIYEAFQYRNHGYKFQTYTTEPLISPVGFSTSLISCTKIELFVVVTFVLFE